MLILGMLIGLCVGGGVGGVIAGGVGISDINDAKKKVEKAKLHYQRETDITERQRKAVMERAETYADYIKHLHQSTLTPVREFLSSIGQSSKAKIIKVLKEVGVNIDSMSDFSVEVFDPIEDLLSLMGAGATGYAASAGTVALVGLLGTASTGAGIIGLSGAAATNATLAWLGGGALAAGGGGMAAGAAVLGGITVAPALLIIGFSLASKGEKALTQSVEFEKNVNKEIAKMKITREFLSGAITRMNELDELLTELDTRAHYHFNSLNSKTFDIDNAEDLANLQKTLLFVTGMSEIIQTPPLDSSGNIAEGGEKIIVKYRKLLKEIT